MNTTQLPEYTGKKIEKIFDLDENENKTHQVKIEVSEFSKNDDYFYHVKYSFDKPPLFIPVQFNNMNPIHKNILTENLIEFLLMDYDLLECYLPDGDNVYRYKRNIINSVCSFCNNY